MSDELSLTLATSNDQIIFHATQDPISSRVVAPALTANAYLGVSNGEIARRLTPQETERLQGFPDGWTRWGPDGEEIADGPRYAMTGNAVAVPVAEWIGRRIMRTANLRTTEKGG